MTALSEKLEDYRYKLGDESNRADGIKMRVRALYDKSRSLEHDFKGLMSRTDDENRKYIWNSESDGNPGQKPRYKEDPVYLALSQVYRRLYDNHKSDRFSWELNMIAKVLTCDINTLIQERKITKPVYAQFDELTPEQIETQMVETIRAYYYQELNKQGFFMRHSDNGKARAVSYSQKIVRKIFLGEEE